MCLTHGAEFTKRKTIYIYFDDMIVLTKPEKQLFSGVIFLEMNLHIGVTKRMTRTEKPDLSGFFATLVLSEKLKN